MTYNHKRIQDRLAGTYGINDGPELAIALAVIISGMGDIAKAVSDWGEGERIDLLIACALDRGSVGDVVRMDILRARKRLRDLMAMACAK